MKLTTVLLIGTFLHLSAAGVAQNVTFSKRNVTLKDVFTQIGRQTGFNIIVADQNIKLSTTVDVNFNNTPVEESIKSILAGLPLSYKIDNKTISIQEKEKSLLDKVVTYFADIDVRGRVVDETGKGLPGATVKIKGTNRSILTNKEGEFFLPKVDEASMLVLSYVGYDVKEVPAVKELGDVSLFLNSGKLEEVKINAGFYSVTDHERTGSITKITAETIGKNPVGNPLMALVGRVPGLQITQSNGNPGAGFTVRLRGQNSINSGNDPLYVVDGVNYPSTGISSTTGINNNLGTGGANPLALINPNDIESIEVLRDADATAIYGSRGANGVILITTKRGKQGAVAVNANISHGFSQVGHMVKLLNTQEYLAMRKEAYFTNDLLTTTSPTYATQYDINGIYDQNRYTDWQELMIGKSAPQTNASLTVSGGSGKSNYLIAANYANEGTVTPGDMGYNRYGVRSNVNLGGNEDRFNASLTLNLSRAESNLLASSGILSSILTAPNAPEPYNQDGQLNWADGTFRANPFAALLSPVKSTTDNLIGNLDVSYKIVKNLQFKTSLGYSTIKRNEFSVQPLASFDPSQGATSATRQSNFGNNYNNNLIIEPQLNYDNKFGKGRISALIGGSLQHTEAQLNVIRATNFTSDDLLSNMAAAVNLSNPQNTFVQYRYVALYSRLNYSYDDKYFLNLTGRRDGSSRFGPGKQFANFGAVGAAWIFSDESLIKDNLSFLSFGKLRGSYGLTGNDQIQDYRFLQLWNASTTYAGTSTFIPDNAAPNPNFAWETNRKLETAIQFGFFKDKLSLEVAWFRNRSSNQLIFQTLPLSAGQGGAYVNLPAEVQNTGWEFNTDLKLFKTTNWNWLASFNLSVPKNKLLSYEGLAASANAGIYEIGQPLNILKTFNVSVSPQSGSYVIEDRNNNGTADLPDRYLVKFLGQKYFGGFQNSVRYKQFNLDILLSFAKQFGRSYIGTSSFPGDFTTSSARVNQFREVLERWQSPGEITSVAKYSTSSAARSLYNNVSGFGNITVVDASYIRLRNVSLSYDLPSNLLSALKIKNAAINLQGQNLFTLTNYVGLDPETGGINLPPLRTIMLGLNATF